MIIAGFGFRTSASADSLLNALEKACRDAGFRLADVQLASTPDDKASAEAYQGFLAHSSLKSHVVTADSLGSAETLTHSKRVADMRGTGSVAEACALLSAGPNGKLMGPRAVSDDHMATCALAVGEDG